MAVLFPDFEKVVVSYLKTNLIGTQYSAAHVGTKKVPADDSQPATQIVVLGNYGAERDYVLKEASLTVEVYADDYATASGLALWVESKIRGVAGDPIKQVEVSVGPVRLADETYQEKRALDVTLLVKGVTV